MAVGDSPVFDVVSERKSGTVKKPLCCIHERRHEWSFFRLMTTATKEERRRFVLMQDFGCVACLIEDELRGTDKRRGTPADVHHLLSGGKRRGHSDTVPLCPWHHRGVAIAAEYNSHVAGEGFLESKQHWPDRMLDALGPSLALHPEAFKVRYGTDDELLDRTNKELAIAESRQV